MSEAGVLFEGVWKKFRRGEVHDSLRDLVPALAGMLRRRSQLSAALDPHDFWALRDVSFAVGAGKALGIIGPNGAGKSTVLKVLTKILRPTRGHCMVRGRIGALIEVAAGFHPDLTGRENVFLQGAIMGMAQADIRRKFDQIVEFAGMGEFIDTPAKRYSSGMNARLGFAIAAHLDPDVLIIDEVLAVGDVRFQQKAFARLTEVVTSGIPVVVVSHQLDRVAALCTHCLLLDHGVVICAGRPGECIERYLAGVGQDGGRRAASSATPVRVHELLLGSGTIRSGDHVVCHLSGDVLNEYPDDVVLGLCVRDAGTYQDLYYTHTGLHDVRLRVGHPFTLEVALQLNVRPGLYVLEAFVCNLATRQFFSSGLCRHLMVELGKPFEGLVQMNGTMVELPGAPVNARAGLP